jgi:CBS domain-containing protein
MKCQDLMNPEVRWVPGAASVFTAARLMRDQSLGFLLVSGRTAGQMMGVVTDRDLAVRACADDRRPAETTVSEIASPEVIVCTDTEDLKVAEERMRSFHKSRLVVVDRDGQPVGVLSLTDILHGDRGWRALKTARGILAREAEVPHPPVEEIKLTPSTPEDEEAALRQETVHGGAWRGSMKEFPS